MYCAAYRLSQQGWTIMTAARNAWDVTVDIADELRRRYVAAPTFGNIEGDDGDRIFFLHSQKPINGAEAV
jgi:hypothetical protein